MKAEFSLSLMVSAVLLLSAFFALAVGLPSSIGQVLSPNVASDPSIIFNSASGRSGTIILVSGAGFINDVNCTIEATIAQPPVNCGIVDQSTGTIFGAFNATGNPGPYLVYVYGNFSSLSQFSLSGHMAFAEFNIVPVSLTTVTLTTTKNSTLTTFNATKYLTTVSNRTTYWLSATHIVTSTTITTVVPGISTIYTTTIGTESVIVTTRYAWVTATSTMNAVVYLTQTIPTSTGIIYTTTTLSNSTTVTVPISTGSTTTTKTEKVEETSTTWIPITITGLLTVTATSMAPFGMDAAMSSPNTPFIIVGGLVSLGAIIMALSKLGRLRFPKIGFRGGGKPSPDQEIPSLDGSLTRLESLSNVGEVHSPSTNGDSTPHLPSSNSPPTVCFRCGAPIIPGATKCDNCDRPLGAPATGLGQDTDLEAEGRLAEHGELVELKEETTPS